VGLAYNLTVILLCNHHHFFKKKYQARLLLSMWSVHSPPSTPTRSSPAPEFNKTPDKASEIATHRKLPTYEQDDAPPLRTDVNPDINMLCLCAAANKVGPPSPSLFDPSSPQRTKRTKLTHRDDEQDQEDVIRYSTTTFDSTDKALLFCWKNPPNPLNHDIKHIGIDTKGEVITTANMEKIPFIFDKLSTVEWAWLKAFDPSLLSHPTKKKNPYTMCNIAQKGVKVSIHRRGICRRMYTMPDHRFIRICHHSCEYLRSTNPSRAVCKNCSNKNWNAKCTGGEDFIQLFNK